MGREENGRTRGVWGLWMTREVQGNDTQRWFGFTTLRSRGCFFRIPPAVDLQLPDAFATTTRSVHMMYCLCSRFLGQLALWGAITERDRDKRAKMTPCGGVWERGRGQPWGILCQVPDYSDNKLFHSELCMVGMNYGKRVIEICELWERVCILEKKKILEMRKNKGVIS